jgi:hypothetical protein
MKSFRQYLIEDGKLTPRWSAWLNSLNTEHPNAPKEASYKDRIRSGDEGRIPKEPGAFELAVANLNKRLKDNGKKMGSRSMGAFFNTDGRGIPTDGLFSISHEAKLINAKTGQKQPKPDSLLVSSNRTEEGDLEFNIRKTTYEDVQDIHRYILPAGAKYDWNLYEFPSGDGHKLKPGASHVLSISDANRVIQEHMLSRIKTGTYKKDMAGITVAQAHGVSF